MPRRLLLVASIHHGNTLAVARAIAGPLAAEIAAPAEIPRAGVDRYQLVGFGSGVYYGRLHHALTDWVGGLPDAASPTRPAILFSSSGLPWLSWLWHRPLRRLLARKGFSVIGEFSCRGFDTWGPLWLAGGLNRKHPDDRDLAAAGRFAEECLHRLPPGG